MTDRSVLFKLLLIQMIYEIGNIEDESLFKALADQLNKHPLLKEYREPKTNKDECKAVYLALLDVDTSSIAVKSSSKVDPKVAALAQMLYREFTTQLVNSMEYDKQQFERIVGEIEQLQKR